MSRRGPIIQFPRSELNHLVQTAQGPIAFDTKWRNAVSLRNIAFLLVISSATAAQAQWGDWGGGWHASTVEEGIQRGFADVVRSQGMANLYNAQATTELEKARSAYLDNRYKATQTFFEMRRYNTESRRSERSSPLSTEQYVRLARIEAPQTLTNTQLDPLTGAISWPTPLARPEYAEHRARLEKLFVDRSSGYSTYADIQKACESFLEQLRADIMKFQANDFVAARRFLDSLLFAARGVQS
jgi:hypothetical protein